MKIGRNDPCPCGSGKKYKKCCLNKAPQRSLPKPNPTPSFIGRAHTSDPILEFINKYDTPGLLRHLAAVQLDPRNHGKNLRFEELIFKCLKARGGNRQVDHSVIAQFFKKHLTFSIHEDEPAEFFTDLVYFFGGSYLVFPGLDINCVQVVNQYLEVLFLKKNTFPKGFLNQVFHGVYFILALSDRMAKLAQLSRYTYEDYEPGSIEVASPEELSKRIKAVTYSREDMENLLNELNTHPAILSEFLVNDHLGVTEKFEPNQNPILSRPLLEVDDGYIVLYPVGTVRCLLSFIKRTAEQHLLYNNLLSSLFEFQFNQTRKLLLNPRCPLTDIEVPMSPISNYGIKESVFRLDIDKLLYVSFIGIAREVSKSGISVEEREKEVVEFIRNLPSEINYKVLSLFVLFQDGEGVYYTLESGLSGELTLLMTFSQLQTIVYDEGFECLDLWKFARALSEFELTRPFGLFSDTLDLFALFKSKNGSFILSYDVPKSQTTAIIRMGGAFKREVLLRRDEHSLPRIENGETVHSAGLIYRSYAPIYYEKNSDTIRSLYLEGYRNVLWFVNHQDDTAAPVEIVEGLLESLAYWMHRIRPALSSFFNLLAAAVIQIEIVCEEDFVKILQLGKVDITVETDEHVTYDIIEGACILKLKARLAIELLAADNRGEIVLMRSLLSALRQLFLSKGFEQADDMNTQGIIDSYMSDPGVKMMLIIDSQKNLKVNSGWISTPRYISKYYETRVQENLISIIGWQDKGPLELTEKKEKLSLCNLIVAKLIGEVSNLLQEFDHEILVEQLLQYNESIIQEKEFQSYQIPVKLLCFSDLPTETEKYHDLDRKTVQTSLAIRTLIEFCTGIKQIENTRTANYDDIDYLLALMNEVVQWGALSDAIQFGLDNPKVELTKSGHIFFTSTVSLLEPFLASKHEEEIDQFINDYRKELEPPFDSTKPKTNRKLVNIEDIDHAYLEDYGASLTSILRVSYSLVTIAFNDQTSCVSLEEGKLVGRIAELLNDLNVNDIENILQIISLPERDSLDVPPPGFDKQDIYPWKFNRDLSLMRRPVVRISQDDGSKLYYWGFRQVLRSLENLQTMTFNTRLKTRPSSALNRVMGRLREKKGKEFRDEVLAWLKETTSLVVFDYEVKIAPKGHIPAREDFGDIDILVYVKEDGLVLSIECKDTVPGRAIHEMKSEMDNYLGRGKNKGLIFKHVNRDNFLKQNRQKLCDFLKIDESGISEICSVVVTSEELSVLHIDRSLLPLPMLSFPSLKRSGFQLVLKNL